MLVRNRKLRESSGILSVAAVQFRRPELVREIKDVLAETGLPADLLMLEVSEDALLSRPELQAGVPEKAAR